MKLHSLLAVSFAAFSLRAAMAQVTTFEVPPGQRLKVSATFAGPWEQEIRIYDQPDINKEPAASPGSWNGQPDGGMVPGPKYYESPVNTGSSNSKWFFLGRHKQSSPHSEKGWFNEYVFRSEPAHPGASEKRVLHFDTYQMKTTTEKHQERDPEGHLVDAWGSVTKEVPNHQYNGMTVTIESK